MTRSLPGFVLRRTAAGLFFVCAVSLGAFVLTRLAPGDATTDLIESGAAPDVIARERARLGLDQPLFTQIGGWARGVARFDLGESSRFRRPVNELVVSAAISTARLAALSLFLATVIGIPLGIMSGAQPRHWVSRVVGPVSLALVSCPTLVAALGLLLFAALTGWLSTTPGALGVPVLALALPLAASLERLQAQATRDAMHAPDLLAAAARGVPPARLIWVHAARQSLGPVLGIYGIVIGAAFGGSFAVEIVTAWPGLGRLMYDALRGRDLFLVTGCALMGALCLAAGNLLADLLRAVADPRARDAV
jgi:peptide/nickel transport system permease protein